MKPANWDQLPHSEKTELAGKLKNSLRGNYIIGQALSLAITEMKKVPMPQREVSNIQDMEMLRETWFTLPCPQDFGVEFQKRVKELASASK